MKLEPRGLRGVFDVVLEPVEDDRGSLTHIFDKDVFCAHDRETIWVQHVISFTERRNTVRGLHAQKSPFTEAKLILPLTGSMFWVVVDLQQGSDSFGRWDGVKLSPESNRALFVERGFAHGCQSVTDCVTLSILSDNSYSPDHGVGIRWDDEELGIAWPVGGEIPIISEAHKANPSFRAFKEQIGGL
jgi:dTDP-4-dehydrorhamnose 3,5-epimerase